MHAQRKNLTNKFFGQLIFFSSFPDFEQKFLEVLRELFGRVVTTAFCVSRWRFFSIFEEGRKWGKKFFPKKLHCYHFHTLNEKDPQCFCKHGYGRLVKNSWYMFRRTFLQIGLLENLSFVRLFRNSSKKFSQFWRETFDRMVTTRFYMCRRTVWGKTIFFQKIHNFSRHLLECEWQFCGFSEKIFW